jgi:predicted Zn-dependent protease
MKPMALRFKNCTLLPGRTALVVACLFVMLCCTGAAPRRVDPPPLPPWADPGALFERLVGKEGEVDEKVLGEIEVTAKEERQIGKRMAETYLAGLRQQRLRFVKRGKDIEYLEQLVEVIHPRMDNRKRYPSIQVYLVLSDRCDARSFPGGHLVFFRGLLESADNEAALIGIVGHELSHLDRGHHTRRIKQAKLAERTFSGRGGAMPMEKFFTVGGVMMRAWLRPFRADYEREADVDGARWSYEAGYDCREMAKLFLKVHERSGNPEIPVPEFFRSHPAASDRHRAIMEQYERLQADRPAAHLHIGEDNLRRRTVHRP